MREAKQLNKRVAGLHLSRAVEAAASLAPLSQSAPGMGHTSLAHPDSPVNDAAKRLRQPKLYAPFDKHKTFAPDEFELLSGAAMKHLAVAYATQGDPTAVVRHARPSSSLNDENDGSAAGTGL